MKVNQSHDYSGGLNASLGFMPYFCKLQLQSPTYFRTSEQTFPRLKHTIILPSSRKAFSHMQGTSEGGSLY